MKSATAKDNKGNNSSGIFYGMYVLSMLLFGTNGYLVSHISLQSSQIVLVRTLIGGILLSAMVLLQNDFTFSRIKPELRNFSPWLFREALTKRKLTAIIIVAVGLLCITGSIAAGKLSMAGLVTAVGSALFYAALIVFNKRIKNTGGLQTAAIELDVAFVVVLLYVLFTSGFSYPLATDIPYLLTIGLLNTGLAYFLYFSSMQRLPAQSVALISYIDPVSALLFSTWLLNENMTLLQIAGAVFIIGGAILGELGD